MKIFLNKKLLFVSVLNFLVILAVTSLLCFRFEENDDVVMCMIANGVYSGTPNSHLVFINALYGCLLVALYTLTDSIEWYTISFLFFHWLSMTIIAFLIYSNDKMHKVFRLVFLLTLYIIWISVLQLLQFTTTSSFIAFAGCLLLLRDSSKSVIGGAMMLFISSLIRFQMCGLMVLLFIPIFILHYRWSWKKHLVLLSIAICLFVGHVADKLFYRTDEWKYYREYNQLRGQINDNPNFASLYTHEFSMDVCREDIDLLGSFMPDPNIWNVVSLKEAIKVLDDNVLNYKWDKMMNLRKYSLVLLLFVLSITIVLVCSPKLGIIGFLYVIFYLAILFGISMVGTLKDRVFLSSFIVALYFVYTIVSYFQRATKFYNACLIFVVFMMSLVAGKYLKRIYNRQQLYVDKVSMIDEQLQLVDHNSLYIMPLCADFSFELLPPLEIKDMRESWIMGGWVTCYPNSKVSYNSYLDLLCNDICLFATKDHFLLIQKMLNVIEFHYNTKVFWEIIDENEKYALVKLNAKTNDTI